MTRRSIDVEERPAKIIANVHRLIRDRALLATAVGVVRFVLWFWLMADWSAKRAVRRQEEDRIYRLTPSGRDLSDTCGQDPLGIAPDAHT